MLYVNAATLAGDRAIQKIAGIKLHAGLRGRYFQNSSRGRFIHSGGSSKHFIPGQQDEIVIVTTSEAQLLVMILHTRTDGGRSGEVERCIFHAAYLTGRNQAFINGSESLGVNGQLVIEHRAAARQVEIGM